MEALVQRQPMPGLHPTPELEGGERDERQATADKQQADKQMAHGEELVQPFRAGGLCCCVVLCWGAARCGVCPEACCDAAGSPAASPWYPARRSSAVSS